MKSAIIMAAGKGTRMQSSLPKVMHEICGKPMIDHIIDSCNEAKIDKIVTVVGYGHELIEKHLESKCLCALQEVQLGTGHAVMQAKELKDEKGLTLVINGDCPCISSETLNQLLFECEDADMVVLTAIVEDARSYGRIVRNQQGLIEKIVEFKDCDEQERSINEINTGIYCFKNELLFENLNNISNNNAQNEYYITDLVEIFNQQGLKVKASIAKVNEEVAGVNDRYELMLAAKWMQEKINHKHMLNGVTIIDPTNTYIGKDVKIGKDVIIYPNNYLNGNTRINENTKILPGCNITNSIIGEGCTIESSKVIDSEIKDQVTVGPYAHIRMHSVIDSKNRIGNFVEFKNTKFGYDSRCAHLTYLGDSEIGSKVNIGCGVVTVNYDGKNKHRTTIKDGAFIGSNVNIIAPVVVGENAVLAAGSTITNDVEAGDMAIARNRQENKSGYGMKYKNK